MQDSRTMNVSDHCPKENTEMDFYMVFLTCLPKFCCCCSKPNTYLEPLAPSRCSHEDNHPGSAKRPTSRPGSFQTVPVPVCHNWLKERYSMKYGNFIGNLTHLQKTLLLIRFGWLMSVSSIFSSLLRRVGEHPTSSDWLYKEPSICEKMEIFHHTAKVGHV
jgi:hypothetical protein